MTAELLARSRRLRRSALPVVVVTAAVAASAACAQKADPADFTVGDVRFEATPEFAAEAAERSTSQPYRLEAELRMAIAVGGESMDVDAPLMSGEQDGELSHVEMDLGDLFDEMAQVAPAGEGLPPELTDADLTMEIVGDGTTMYLRAPMFGALADMAGGAAAGQLGPMGELADLGSKWGRVDLGELGDILPLNDVASAAGGQAIDPRAFFDLVSGTDQVEDLGEAEVRGVEVHGLAAETTLGELLDASGADPDELAGTLGNGLPADGEEFFDSFLDTPMPVELWTDDQGYVRRLDYEMDFAAMFESAGLDDEIGGGAPDEFSYGFTMDFFDYGDDSIVIELPDPDETVDVTDAFLELYEGSGS
jgi:hypothetical protein